MKTLRPFAYLAVAVLSVGAARPALALANRVFVSARSGNNANSCDSIATPCQTLQGAVSQLNPGGEAIILDTGGYGPVSITQSVTIEAATGVTGFIHPPSGDAVTINVGPTDSVVLRGLTLNGGAGNGINFNTGGNLFVESCVINGFAADGVRYAGSARLSLKDSVLRTNGTGVEILSSASSVAVSVDHCRFEQNSATGFTSQATVPVKGIISNSVFFAGGQGINFQSPDLVSAQLTVDRCTIATNVNEGVRGAGILTFVRVSNSVVTNNDRGLRNPFIDANVLSRSDNTIQGNSTCDLCPGVSGYSGN
jgi:hypothetical protein